MDIKAALLAEHSKAQTMMIVNYIGNDQERFDELLGLFLGEEYRVTQRAAWVVTHCAEARPYLVQHHLKPILDNLERPGLHDAVKRSTVKFLSEIEIPEELQLLIEDGMEHGSAGFRSRGKKILKGLAKLRQH